VKVYETLIRKGWWAICLVLLAGAILLGRHAPGVPVDAGTSVLLNENDPDLIYYERTRPQWGYDEYAILCLTRDDWISPEGLRILRGLVDDLEAVEEISTVTSILKIPLLRQEDGPMINPTKVPFLETEGVDLDRARAEMLHHTQAAGNLISAGGKSLAVLAYLDQPQDILDLDAQWSTLKAAAMEDPAAETELEALRPALEAAKQRRDVRRTAMVAAVRKIAAKWGGEIGAPVRLSGTTIINANLMEHLDSDLHVFGLASFLLFLLAFILIYHKVRFSAFPILACVLPVLYVLGTMYVLDMSLTLITANLPVLLFTLMLPYTIYFMERYRERRARFPQEDQPTSTVQAAAHVWVPCLFSCLTTMAGFAALMTSLTKPVHDFGLMMAVGMGIGLCVVFLAIPALFVPLQPLVVKKAGVDAGPNILVRLFERLSLRAPGAVILASLVLLGVAVWGASKLSAQSKFNEYFKADSEVYLGLEYIDKQMGGTTPLEVVLESKEPNHFLKPEGLAQLAAVQRYFEGVPETGNVRSLRTLVDELEKKNPKIVMLLPIFAKLPMVRSATSELANEDFSIARVLVRMRETAPTLDRNVILDGLKKHLAAEESLQGLEVHTTGIFLLYANMLNTLMQTQKETFVYVVTAIFLMLLLLFRSLPLAGLVLATQILPSIVMLGLMGWMGVPLDLVTVMIASIAMGVGIDASIQYTSRYQAELAVDGDRRAALVRAHATIGRSIWIATSVIIAGFCVLTLSEFKPSIYLGLFTAVAMLMSQLAALTILPSIFLLTGYPRYKPAKEPHGQPLAG
jgi:predicted RND superfamily exporter protein